MKRRKEIYAICSKYDVLIVEDDPYWYMQYPSAATEEAKSRNLPRPEQRQEEHLSESLTGYPFMDSLVPSFISVDTDGRVIRLDTFSKTIAPGCRLGWITAQPALIEKYLRYETDNSPRNIAYFFLTLFTIRITESSTQQPSGFVQSMVAELVMGPQPPAAKSAFAALRSSKDRSTFTGWRVDGWVRWLEGLRGSYERRMTRVCRTLDQGSTILRMGRPAADRDADWGVVIKTRLFDFAWPRGGMFIWLRVNFEKHPTWGSQGSSDGVVDGPMLGKALMLFLAAKPFRVLAAPGSMFSTTEEVLEESAWAYYRLCFAAETEERVDVFSERFVEGVQQFWKIRTAKQIEDILKSPLQVAAPEEESTEGDMGNLGAWMGC